MSDPTPFPGVLPGFEFLQSLVRQAGAALPGVGQWVAPTLDPAELDKRINDLRTVQFWLEQNARMLGTTIQALEVQRMTLSTLQSMNVSMGDLRDAMTIKVPEAAPAPAPEPAPEPAAEPAAAAPAPAPGVVDPLQWWGQLTRQFGDLAAQALKDAPATAQSAPVPAAPAPRRPAAAPAPRPARRPAAPAPRRADAPAPAPRKKPAR